MVVLEYSTGDTPGYFLECEAGPIREAKLFGSVFLAVQKSDG